MSLALMNFVLRQWSASFFQVSFSFKYSRCEFLISLYDVPPSVKVVLENVKRRLIPKGRKSKIQCLVNNFNFII